MNDLAHLKGMKFNRLTFVERAKNKGRLIVGIFDCDCGEKGKVIYLNPVVMGTTQSCGCLRRETAGRANTGKSRGQRVAYPQPECLLANVW